MRRVPECWSAICDPTNLYAAWRLARRGKAHRASVGRFALNLEQHLVHLQRVLEDGTWQPGEYYQFTIYERKPRLISAAPFADRVVHHAIMRVIEPLLDKRFIDDSYACRKGKGVHAAVNRYQHYAKRYTYCIKLDISRYFPSIDHALLKAQLQRRLKCRQTLLVLERIIDHSPPAPFLPAVFPGDDLLTPLERRSGIPIGNLTSQFFANLYLDDLDHCIKEQWRIPGYVRYVDDLFLFHNNKVKLWETVQQIGTELQALRLLLHPHKIALVQCRERVDVLGYLVSRERRWLRNSNGYRFRRRLRGMQKRYRKSEVFFADFSPSINAWIGHAQHGETQRLREQMFDEIVFRRATAGC